MVQALSEKLGPEVAAALMECVPPFSWMELPTKQDLRALEERIELRFQILDARFGTVDARFGTVDARFGELGSHLDARLHAEVTRSIRWTVGAVFGGLTLVAGAAVGIAAILA